MGKILDKDNVLRQKQICKDLIQNGQYLISVEIYVYIVSLYKNSLNKIYWFD